MTTRYVIDVREDDDHVLLTGFEAVIEDVGALIIDRRPASEALPAAREVQRLRDVLSGLLVYARGNPVVLDLIHTGLDPTSRAEGDRG